MNFWWVLVPCIPLYLYALRRLPLVFWKNLGYSAMAVVALLGMYNTVLQRSQAHTNRQILNSIDSATNADAKSQQEQLLNLLINRIDCNSQRQTQKLADELKKIGIPPEGSITLITDACVKDRLAVPTTTTLPGN
jgi:hypothetical protein